MNRLTSLLSFQAVHELVGLAMQVKAAVDCKGLGYTLGYAFADFTLRFAAADAASGLGKFATGALREGLAAEGGSPCRLCFPAGTLVATPDGEKPIEQVQLGDQVLAEDPSTGKVEAEPVQGLIVHPVSELAKVDLSDGSTVTVTADHPFYVDASTVRTRSGWIEAGYLRIGDRMRDASGVDVIVTGVRYNVGRAVVYTLSVAKDHTFFVGTARVLVHNSTVGPSGCPLDLAVRYDGSYYLGTAASDPNVFIRYARVGTGVDVTDVFRRVENLKHLMTTPPGSGGAILAEALNLGGVSRPSFIRISSIMSNQPTLEQLAGGMAFGDTILGRVAIRAAHALGGTVESYSTGVDAAGKPYIQVTISYGH